MSDKFRGIMWFLLACLSFAAMATFIKLLSNAGASTPTMIFLRNVLAVVVLIPFIKLQGMVWPKLNNKKLFFYRTAVGFGTMLLMFYSLVLLPVNDFVALSFTIPIFASVGAVLILGEKMGIHRWTAVFIGFAGALIIIQPSAEGVSFGYAVCLVFCVLTSLILLMVKTLSANESSFDMLYYLHLWMGYMSIPLIIFTYHEINLEVLTWGGIVALTSISAHYGLVKSYQYVDLTMTTPFEFSRILLASGFAYIFLGEIPASEAYLGAAIIVASTIYIAKREALKKNASKNS